MYSKNQIYTTGAYLKPLKTKDVNGNEVWVWYVTEFSESSFQDGVEIEAKEFSKDESSLISLVSN
jgi:hypothetical protein